MGEECEDLKCGFYATCQMYVDDVGNEVNDDDVISDVINEVTAVGSERGRARCVCPAFCPQVGLVQCVQCVGLKWFTFSVAF